MAPGLDKERAAMPFLDHILGAGLSVAKLGLRNWIPGLLWIHLGSRMLPFLGTL